MFDMLEDEDQTPDEEKPTDWSGTIIGGALLPVFLLFIHEGMEDLGLNICLCLLDIAIAVKRRWDLSGYSWFWIVVSIVGAINVPIVFLIHWPHGWVPSIALLPIALADCLITLTAVRLVENYIVKTTPST